MRNMSVLPFLAVFLLLFAVSTSTHYSYSGCDKPNKLLCQDVFTAQECGVLDLCFKSWNNHPWKSWTTDLSVSCIYCLYMSDTNRTSVVNWASHRLQKSSDAYEINKFTSMLRFENHKDGDEVMCNVLSACKSHTYMGDLNFGDTLCNDCKMVVDEIRSKVSDNATAEVIVDVLDNVICQEVPEEFRNICLYNVKEHVPIILHLIEKQINSDEICRFLNLCHGSISENLSLIINTLPSVSKRECTKQTTTYSWINRPTEHGSAKWTSYNGANVQQPDCGECNAVLKVMQQRLSDVNVQQFLISELKKHVCSFVSILEKVCEHEIDSQSQKIFYIIIHSDTNEVCRYFGMCFTDTGSGSSFVQKITKYYVTPQLPLTEGVSVPGVCQLCELVISKVIGIVLDEVTEERITAALDEVCRLIPTQYEAECDQLVKQYGSLIVKEIINGTTPKIVCVSLGLCQSSTQRYTDATTIGGTVRSVIPLLFSDMLQLPRYGNLECALCRQIQSAINSSLNDKNVLSMIKNEMKALCQYSSASTADCIGFIDNNFDAVVGYVKLFMAEADLCELFGVCQHTKNLCSTNPDYRCSNLRAAIECSSIQSCIALGKAASLLVVDQSQCEQLSLADTCVSLELTHACNRQEQCQVYKMANLLQSAFGSSSAADVSAALVSPNKATAVPGDYPPSTDSCGFCRNLVEELALRRRLLGLPAIGQARCASFRSADERSQCGQLVAKMNEVMPDIVSGLQTSMQICQKHALCATSDTITGRRTSSFGSSCADGHSYWCSSPRTAAICKAENYCKVFGYSSSVNDNLSTTTTTESQAGDKQDIFGLNSCEYGSTFWCQSRSNAERCGSEAVRHCETHVWHTYSPCSWGPSFWCASEPNAKLCGKRLFCKVHNKRLPRRNN